MMTNMHDDNLAFECVEPGIGEHIWRGALPDASPADRALREDHLRICDACRLEAAVGRSMSDGLASGHLVLPHPAAPRVVPLAQRSSRLIASLSAGAASMAAMGLLLVMLMPPVAPAGFGADRSGAEEGFVRPVEGEVAGPSGLDFHWHGVDGARSYQLRVEEIGGDFVWEGESREPSLTLPKDVALPVGAEFRAYLVPMPRDLAPAGGLSVRFRSGNLGAVLRYRAQASPLLARLMILGGLVLACGALIMGFRDRRHITSCTG